MYVCICSAVTEEHISEAVREGKTDFASVARATGVAMGCGTCGPMAAHIIDSLVRQAERIKAKPQLYYPARTSISSISTTQATRA